MLSAVTSIFGMQLPPTDDDGRALTWVEIGCHESNEWTCRTTLGDGRKVYSSCARTQDGRFSYLIWTDVDGRTPRLANASMFVSPYESRIHKCKHALAVIAPESEPK